MSGPSTDVAAVLAANDAFYQAFESLDVDRMRAVWLDDARIRCTHPGWPVLAGVEAVMESWARIFAGALEMRFALANVSCEVEGDVAWVVCVEQLQSRHPDGSGGGLIQATNLFQRVAGRWLVVHHHGSPLAAPPSPPPESMH